MAEILQNPDGSMNWIYNSAVIGEQGRYPQKAINILRLASDVADTETVTIGGVIFEFDRAANGVTAGNVAVTGHADDTNANASVALVTAVNASAACPMSALKIGDTEVLFISKAYGAQVHACTETLAGSNNAFAAAAAYGGKAASGQRIAAFTRVPNAAEVALGTLEIALTFAPKSVNIRIVVTSTGVAKAWDGGITIDATNKVVKLDNTGSTDWAATDTIHYQIFE